MVVPLIALIVVIAIIIGFVVFAGKKKEKGQDLGER